MTDFEIHIRRDADSQPDDPQGIRISSRETVFTRLLRLPGGQSDDYLLAPPAQLAFWFVDNWWRLRWEARPTDAMVSEWRLAHDLSAVGGGHAWPRLELWGDTDRIALLCRPDPVGVVGPVRYLTNALSYIAADQFETETDRFLDVTADEQHAFCSDRASLRAQIILLMNERNDPDTAKWRRLEARLGFDPDAGPEALIRSVDALGGEYGFGGVEEAISAAPGTDATSILQREIEAVRGSGSLFDFSDILGKVDEIPRQPSQLPWVAAEKAAHQVREIAGIGGGPLRNERLSTLLGVSKTVFKTRSNRGNHVYGLRLAKDNEQQLVSLASRWPGDRRFSACRVLGDALWARGEVLGPLAKSSTARQRFQRAFAQSLLCPFDDLKDYLDTEAPDDSDISAAAAHFHVAERVVQTVLVNKGALERRRFEDMIEAA